MMEIKWGRNGKFLACPGYKDDPPCKNTQNFEKLPDGTIKIVAKEDPTTDEKCEKCSSPMVIKIGRFGKFIACSGYPDCKTTKPVTLGIACPEAGCTGELVERRSKRGRTFFGCSAYPACKFVLWQRPVAEPCPSCGSPFLTERTARGRTTRACVKEGCGFKQEATATVA